VKHITKKQFKAAMKQPKKLPLKIYISEHLQDGFLLISCGLPGTGKSTAVEAVHKIRGGVLLQSDVIRREMMKDLDVTDPKVAADMKQRETVYEELFKRADEAFNNQEKNVIMDATFITQELRRRAATLAAWHKTALVIVETVCPEEVGLGRILGRNKATSISNALTAEAYNSNKNKWEDVDLDDLKTLYPELNLRHITVDTVSQPYVVGDEIK
jgi:predicted kinase